MDRSITTYILVAIFLLAGLFYIIAPKTATKKEYRDSEENIKKVRKRGIYCLVFGIAFVAIEFLHKI